MTQIKELSDFIQISKNTVFFGGAGVSTDSGIPDFRSASGLYSTQLTYGYHPEELLSHSFFRHRPGLFFRYYRENLIARQAMPNAAHISLARLEEKGLLKAIITQNIDGLHQAAGSKNVLELHGSNWRQHCNQCKAKYVLEYVLAPKNIRNDIPICQHCGGIVRPDVVLYEEPLDDTIMQTAIQAISLASLLIVGGTSLAVYPAAGLLRYFGGQHLVLINKSQTPYDNQAEVVIHDAIGEVLHAVWVILSNERQGVANSR